MREIGDQSRFVISLSTIDFSLLQVFQVCKFNFILLSRMLSILMSESSNTVGVVSNRRIG